MKQLLLVFIPLLFALGLIVGLGTIFASNGTLPASAHPAPSILQADDLSLLYTFSGVTDDGEQGSASRKEATSIHCTNIWTGTVQVEVDVYQWNGLDVYTGTVNMPPGRTFTYSTQNTTIYFDDVLLGGSPGTPAIFQGHGRVYTDNPYVVCTAQALDPLNYPPQFAVKLPMADRYGSPVDHQLPRPDLALIKTSQPSVALPGQPVSYTVTYTNQGANIAAGTVITDIMPTALTDISVISNPPLPLEINSHYVWDAGGVFPGESGVITISGKINPALTADTSILNRVVISGQSEDIGTGPDEAQAVIDVQVPLISLSAANYQILEDGGSRSVAVTIDVVNPYSPVTVNYQTSDISATAGMDYESASGTLTFNPGQDSRTFNIYILDDNLLEGNETLQIDLALPSGGSLGSPDNATITILDDEYGVYLPLIRRE